MESGSRNPGRCGLRLRHLPGHPGFGDHGHVHRVEITDLVEASEADDDLVAGLIGHGAADHAGVAALRHHRDTPRGADLHRGGEFAGIAGPDDGGRGALVEVAPIVAVRLRVGAQQHASIAQHGVQGGEQLAAPGFVQHQAVRANAGARRCGAAALI